MCLLFILHAEMSFCVFMMHVEVRRIHKVRVCTLKLRFIGTEKLVFANKLHAVLETHFTDEADITMQTTKALYGVHWSEARVSLRKFLCFSFLKTGR